MGARAYFPFLDLKRVLPVRRQFLEVKRRVDLCQVKGRFSHGNAIEVLDDWQEDLGHDVLVHPPKQDYELLEGSPFRRAYLAELAVKGCQHPHQRCYDVRVAQLKWSLVTAEHLEEGLVFVSVIAGSCVLVVLGIMQHSFLCLIVLQRRLWFLPERKSALER